MAPSTAVPVANGAAQPQIQQKQTKKTFVLGVFSHVKWEHLAAGVAGGVTATLCLHPLDLIKIRFQVNEGHGPAKRPKYNGMIHAARSIYMTEGVKGLYQGVVPNVWGAGSSWGLYFFFYNWMKNWMQDGNAKTQLDPRHHITAACASGAFTLAITNPIWVTKTRLCLQYDKVSPNASHSNEYRGMFHALRVILQTEGIKGLYKGFVPGLFGVSHGALQFMAYEECKNVYNNYRHTPIDTKLSSIEYILFAAISKIFAASATYPYQVVRSRLQDQHRQYSGVLDVIKETWRYEGAYGFYKGLTPSLIRVTPACCITFLMYENMMHFLKPVVPHQ